jgi:hypothetical protein
VRPLRRDRRHGAGLPRPAHHGHAVPLHHDPAPRVACAGSPSIYIGKRGRWGMAMTEHSRAIRSRQAAAPIDAKPGTFASIVERCEVAFLYDRGCVPSYTIDMIEFDEPPWDRFLNKPWGRFVCPGCGQPLDMHVSHGPGTPGTERFQEAS